MVRLVDMGVSDYVSWPSSRGTTRPNNSIRSGSKNNRNIGVDLVCFIVHAGSFDDGNIITFGASFKGHLTLKRRRTVCFPA